MITTNSFSIDHRRASGRRGATLVEAAISLILLLTVLIFLLDFAIASFRSQSLNYLADRLARTAAVHGPKAVAGWNGGTWGPTTMTTKLSGSDNLAAIARSLTSTLPNDAVTLTVSWPSGSNAIGQPVVVTAEMNWTPSLIRPMIQSVMTLRGVGYHRIAH